jgi:hypothetical protein
MFAATSIQSHDEDHALSSDPDLWSATSTPTCKAEDDDPAARQFGAEVKPIGVVEPSSTEEELHMDYILCGIGEGCDAGTKAEAATPLPAARAATPPADDRTSDEDGFLDTLVGGAGGLLDDSEDGIFGRAAGGGDTDFGPPANAGEEDAPWVIAAAAAAAAAAGGDCTVTLRAPTLAVVRRSRIGDISGRSCFMRGAGSPCAPRRGGSKPPL